MSHTRKHPVICTQYTNILYIHYTQYTIHKYNTLIQSTHNEQREHHTNSIVILTATLYVDIQPYLQLKQHEKRVRCNSA